MSKLFDDANRYASYKLDIDFQDNKSIILENLKKINRFINYKDLTDDNRELILSCLTLFYIETHTESELESLIKEELE